MTTRTAPDYHLELEMALKDFRAICGTAFAVDVVFEKRDAVNGELIIPEFNDFPEFSNLVKAWLWLNKPVKIEPGTEVTAILREPSDYKITEQQYNELLAHQGLRIKGSVASEP